MEKHVPPWQRVREAFHGDGQEITAVLLYGVLAGILSLAVPLTVQMVVNTVALGALQQQLMLLTVVTFVLVLATGVVRIFQVHIAEGYQRRIAARIALALSYLLPKRSITSLKSEYGADYMNRFMEVFTVQKGVAGLLLDSTKVIFQITVGIVLLSFYHPFFLLIALSLSAAVTALLFFTHRRGHDTSYAESDAKYGVLAWLEDLASHDHADKSDGYLKTTIQKTESLLTEYLRHRRSHFVILQSQKMFAYLLQAIAFAVVLGTGGRLISEGKLTLGQLVAAELVLASVLNAFLSGAKQLENYYDLGAGLEKLSQLLKSSTSVETDDEQRFNSTYPTLEEIESALKCQSNLRGELGRSRGLRSFIYCTIFGMFGVTAFLVYAPWVQTIQGGGKIVAFSPTERPQVVEAPVEGRITNWFVREGQVVKADEPLVQLADIDPQIMERLELERESALRRIQAAEQALATSGKNLGRQRSLSQKGLSSERAFELAGLEVAKFEGDLASARAELAKIEVRLSRQSSQTVRAVRNGIISRIHAPQGGEFVKAGDPLATLVPETTDRAVELFVSGNDVPLLQVGRTVRMQFEGWPALQFTGWPAVAVGTFSGTLGLIDPVDDGTGRFRILVFPDNKEAWPSSATLRLGVRAVGWVLLDEVSVGWELWRRFNGFPPTITTPPAGAEKVKASMGQKK